MGRIPLIISRAETTAVNPPDSFSRGYGSDSAFGGATSRALGELERGAGQMASAVNDRARDELARKRAEDLANQNAQFPMVQSIMEARRTAPADAAGHTEAVARAVTAQIDARANQIADPIVRSQFRVTQRQELARRQETETAWQFGQQAEHSAREANTSLEATTNRVRADPNAYESAVRDAQAVIAARPGLSAAQIQIMQEGARQSIAKARFEARIQNARSPEELDVVLTELTRSEVPEGERDWRKELKPQDFDRMIDTARTARTTMSTAFNTNARAAVASLEERAKADQQIDVEELASVARIVRQSTDETIKDKFARIARDQDWISRTRGMRPEDIRAIADAQQNAPARAARSQGAPTGPGEAGPLEPEQVPRTGSAPGPAPAGTPAAAMRGVPPALAGYVNEAARFAGVSPGYLAATVAREAGTAARSGDYGVRNYEGASTATGLGQFVDGTWLRMLRNNDTRAPTELAVRLSSLTGQDLRGMSDQQLLALRADPRLSILMTAAYASENARLIKPVLGRDPSEGELYVAHFLGAGGANTLFRALKSNPNAIAAELLPVAAGANPTVFNRNGQALTVEQLYGRLTTQFTQNPTRVAYGDSVTLNRRADAVASGLRTDPMRTAAQEGRIQISPIDGAGGMQERGVAARSVAEYYGLPIDSMKPFTAAEAEQLTKRLRDGNADEVLSVMQQIQGMGGDMARAAFKQLGQENTTFGHAAALAAARPDQVATASDIVRGQKQIDADSSAVQTRIGASTTDMNTAFDNFTKQSLLSLDPSSLAAVRQAAIAHYVQTAMPSNLGKWNETAFKQSIQAVLGGQGSVDTVNGSPTVMPRGVTGREFDGALDKMTAEDYAQMSPQNTMPRYANGQIAAPDEIAREGQFRALGGNRYRIQMADGNFLTTGRPAANGRAEVYVFQAEPARIKEVNARQAPRTPGPTTAGDLTRQPPTMRQPAPYDFTDPNILNARPAP